MTEAGEFTVGEVATMTGLSTHTIRAWERRHGALAPSRTAARQRRYSREDVDFLLRVKQLTRAGGRSVKVAIEEARGNVPLEPAIVATAPPAVLDTTTSIWRSVADFLPLLVAILDTRGRIIDCNIPLVRAVGKLRSEVRQMRFVDLIDPHDRAKAARIYRPPLRPHPSWELNVKMAGLQALYSFDCRPVREGERWVIACIGRDLTHAGVEIWPQDGQVATRPPV